MINKPTVVHNYRRSMIGLTLCWLLLGSCTLAIPQLQSANSEPSAAHSRGDKPIINNVGTATSKNFTPETLYSLLAAEMAGSREQYDIALSNYAQQAKETHDPQVAERAALIARYLGNNALALEMSLIWLEAAPKNSDALTSAAMAYLHMGRLQDAFVLSERLLSVGGEPLFQTIAANATSLNDMERATLLAEYNRLLNNYPNNEQLLIGAGLLLQQQASYNEALHLAHRVLKQKPRSIPAAILEANLLHQLKRDKEAIAKMAKLLDIYPNNTSLRQQYARILTHHDMGLAQEQLLILSEQLPNNGDIRLSLGIVALERRDTETAKEAFETLLDKDQHLSSAHYYLGHMAEAQGDLPEAVIHYLQVDNGNNFLSATTNLLDIFVRQQDFLSAEQHLNRLRLRMPEQSESLYLMNAQTLIKYEHFTAAHTLLNKALLAHKNSSSLLFARAMLSYERNELIAAERDLQHLLKLDPNHAQALNSLGYILADRTQRFDEAHQLLTKALALNPEDAAVMDSMGWLLYRTGNYSEALIYLRKAYASAVNPEIGAHLGELLWVVGDKEGARQVWTESLKIAPQDPAIRETLNRLKADL